MQYREELTQIGKVVKLNESSVSVEWLVGSYSGTFSFWKERGRVICESFLLRGTVCHLKLTPAMNLLKLMFVGWRKSTFQQNLSESVSFIVICSIVVNWTNCYFLMCFEWFSEWIVENLRGWSNSSEQIDKIVPFVQKIRWNRNSEVKIECVFGWGGASSCPDTLSGCRGLVRGGWPCLSVASWQLPGLGTLR